MNQMNLNLAIEKVRNNDLLNEHYERLIEYDYPDFDGHLEWILQADQDEILDWCMDIPEREVDCTDFDFIANGNYELDFEDFI